jgi:zinc transport system ATP-binding protein
LTVIEVGDGAFGYAGQTAVSASLKVDAGEVVALLGPNGSGKTTLLKGVLGLVDCYRGDVKLFGTPLSQFGERSRIGYVPQRQSAAGPIPVTVRELVRSGLMSGRRVIRRRARTATSLGSSAVADALVAVGLADLADRPIVELSGGQQRRALVARALAGGATTLLLDEPFAGVDQANQLAIADALAHLTSHGATIVVVLHELGPLEPIVTRAVCLDHGVVLFDGPLGAAPARLLHLGHDHDPHGGEAERSGIGLIG